MAPDKRPLPPPRPRKIAVRPVPVQVRADLVKQMEKKAEPEPEKPVARKPEPKPEPKPKPKKKQAKPSQPKAPTKPKPQPTKPPPAEPEKVAPKPAEPAKPKPFVLKNVALKGGVAVQTGEDSNLFGDPTVDAKGFKKGIDAPMSPNDGQASEKAPAREPVVIKQPKALNDVKGEYPAAYRDLRRVVRVELLLTVGRDGSVGKVRVKKGAEKEFNDSAIKAVRQLKFEPATKNGVPIAFNLKWTVVFIPETS